MGVVLGRIPAPAGAPGAPLYTSPFSHPQVMYTKHPQGLRKLSAVLRTDVLSCCAPSQDSSTSSPRHSPASADRSARTSCSATRLWHRPAYVCGTPSHLAAERTPSHLAAERPGRADLGPAGCAVRAGALCPSESGRQRVATGGPSRCCCADSAKSPGTGFTPGGFVRRALDHHRTVAAFTAVRAGHRSSLYARETRNVID